VRPLFRSALIITVTLLAALIAFEQPVLSRSLGFGVVIVGLKIAADVHAHVAERRKFSPAGVRT
jgi:hypothetical protein